MTSRWVTSLDLRTGDIVGQETTAEDLPFDERVASMNAQMEEHMPGDGPVLERKVALVCDGCGVMVELQAEAPLWPEGWGQDDRGDICPKCVGEAS